MRPKKLRLKANHITLRRHQNVEVRPNTNANFPLDSFEVSSKGLESVFSGAFILNQSSIKLCIII